MAAKIQLSYNCSMVVTILDHIYFLEKKKTLYNEGEMNIQT